MSERNPIILPEVRRSKPSCPSCGHETFSGRSLGGAIRFTCHSCQHKWSGGLPVLAPDPDNPLPPSLVTPTIQFLEVKDKGGHTLSVEELRTPPNKTSDFRKGALVKDEGEI